MGYFAVNGVTKGPLGLDEIRSKFASGEVGDEAYVWHDTFDQWEPVAKVEAFTEALAAGQALKPRAKTLGFTGKLQAVTAPDGPNKSTSGSVPSPSETAEPPKPKKAAKPAEPASKAESAESSDKAIESDEPAPKLDSKRASGPREDKLAALRAKLK